MLEIVLTNEELKALGYEGRIDFDEGQRVPSSLPLIDQTGNMIGEADIELTDCQHQCIGQGRISARYRITSLRGI